MVDGGGAGVAEGLALPEAGGSNLPVERADCAQYILAELAKRVATCKAAADDVRRQVIDSQRHPARDKDRICSVISISLLMCFSFVVSGHLARGQDKQRGHLRILGVHRASEGASNCT